MTPWKAQCSYEDTGQCGTETEYTGSTNDHRSVMYGLTEENKQRMDKTKIAKMDMEGFRQLKDAEYELNKWRNLAGAMHQYIIDGNTAGAIEAYEDVCDGLYDKVHERMIKDA